MRNTIAIGLLVKFTWLTMLCCIPSDTNAQSILKKIKSKVENAATGKILNQTEKAIEKSMDKVIEAVEEGNSKNRDNDSIVSAQSGSKTQEGKRQLISNFSRYDFIPGDTILYIEDFESDVLGEIPLGWNSNRSSVIVSLEDISGKWLRLAQNSVSLTANEKFLGNNFTAEFDLVVDIDFKGWLPPSLQFGILASGKEPSDSNKFLGDPKGDKSFYMEVSPLLEAGNINLESYTGYVRHFNSSPERNPIVKSWYGRPVRVAIHGQNERLRIWVDGRKLYDVPKGIAKPGVMNQMFFRLGSSPYQDEQIGVYVGNIKITKGVPDIRRKLVRDGRLSTTGILFETASAFIRPESWGVLRSIADILEQEPAIRMQIVGHTDDVGDEAINLSLSIKRAEAVRDWLITTGGIDSNRLTGIGKGEKEPVSENRTSSGRADNRRVEFISI